MNSTGDEILGETLQNFCPFQ